MDDLLALTERAEGTHFWFRGFRRFVAPVLRELAAGRTDLRLLDCGCGTGNNLSLLMPYGRAAGFDLAPGGVGHARRSGRAVVRADVTRIPFASETFNVATSFDVLQCVEPDVASVREMTRILRPGGVLVLTLAAWDMLSGDHGLSWREVRRYTPRTARRLVEEAGLHVERISFLFASVFPLMLVLRVGQRLLRPFRPLRPDTDIAVPVAPVNAALSGLMVIESWLARVVPMPIGSSVLVVARKPVTFDA